jgi:2,3-dihydroxyethylbenzene 1,2-dioxygenase
MTRVTELGYLGLQVSDLQGWQKFATQIVGMELVDEGEGDRIYLRLDQWHHRFVLHQSTTDGLAYLGWRVADEVELMAMATQLEHAAIAFTKGTRAEADERRVLGLLKLTDPGGHATEIFYAPQVDRHKPFHPGRPMFGRFVTGSQGLGHLLLGQPDVEAAKRFYRLLGLSGDTEYRVPVSAGGELDLTFMHLNDRQHSIAFGVGEVPTGLNHLMLEYTDLNDLGQSHDLVRKRGIDVALQLGKHANDEALSFYFPTPSGWLMELGIAGRAPSAQQEFYRRDIFGHANEAAGYGNDIELN